MFSIACLSDVHIREPQDESAQLFLRFLGHECVGKADTIIFLGDIFDCMVGPYSHYLVKFREIFEAVNDLAETKRVCYFQGNHDFYLEKLFKRDTDLAHLKKIEVYRKGQVFSLEGQNIYFEHGDDAEIGNISYKAYKKVINSFFISFLVHRILNDKIVDWSGRLLSFVLRGDKRLKYSLDHSSFSKAIKHKFRLSAQKVAREKSCSIVVLGHSHVKDHYKSSEGLSYFNNGYVPKERCFTFLQKESQELVSIV